MSKETKGTTVFIHDKHAKMLDEMLDDESRSRLARRLIKEGYEKWLIKKEINTNVNK